MTDAPTPAVDDPDTGGYWQAAQRGVLAVQWCGACDLPVHLPRPQCPRCASAALTWREVDGGATVYSWAVVHHPVHRAFSVPYTVALVALAAHPTVRFITHLDGVPPLRAGQAMRFITRPDAAGVRVPQWVPISERAEGD
ncbi:Zn-ribbon domain-containing OB-fold protein [Mycolicibacterium celeriflavum]|uniref:Zn-ribbon domain-containing OB-fold protein n=1 Tax=Mycolicibacterium celeriflavum TaxID=1249101 RepID=UPI003CEB0F9E